MIPDESQFEVPIPKLDQCLWAVTSNARKLAEEDQLDPKPAKLERHLSCGQQHAGKFGQILDVYRSTLPLCVVEILFISNNLKHLRSVSIITP